MFDSLPALSAPKPTELLDELDCYLSTDPEHVPNALSWWHEQRKTYPRLSRMALDYLSIPGKDLLTNQYFFLLIVISPTATTVDVERIFSQGRILLPHVRNRLSVQSTRALLSVGIWSKLGYIEDEDVKLVTVQAELEGEEESLEDGWDKIVVD
jgi:hypothetical protein